MQFLHKVLGKRSVQKDPLKNDNIIKRPPWIIPSYARVVCDDTYIIFTHHNIYILLDLQKGWITFFECIPTPRL